jgi:hypothetical protein
MAVMWWGLIIYCLIQWPVSKANVLAKCRDLHVLDVSETLMMRPRYT